MKKMYLIFEGFERDIIPIEKLSKLDEFIKVKIIDDKQKSYLSGDLKTIKEKLGLLDQSPPKKKRGRKKKGG